ncbi:MAG: GNAT family N-acetyltransferase [Chryseobacterium sp.]
MHGEVSLRPLRSKDADAFFTWAGDKEVTQSLFWDAHSSVEDAKVFLTNVVESHSWFMTIVFNGTPVGAITLDQGRGRAEKRAELGYVLAKKYWGRGIVTKAVKIALQKGFEDLGIVRIEAYVDPHNMGSVRVLEKAGMCKEGYLKKYLIHRGNICDRIIFAMTK